MKVNSSNSLNTVQQPAQKRFHIVFDLDGTFVSYEKIALHKYAQLPGGIYLQAAGRVFFVHHGFIETLAFLIQRGDCDISFFSSASAERNHELLDKIFKILESRYPHLPKIKKHILSSLDLNDKGQKDLLTVIGKKNEGNLINTTLVDDQKRFVVAEQYASWLKVPARFYRDKSTSKDTLNTILRFPTMLDEIFISKPYADRPDSGFHQMLDFYNNYYIAGVLSLALEAVDEHPEGTLNLQDCVSYFTAYRNNFDELLAKFYILDHAALADNEDYQTFKNELNRIYKDIYDIYQRGFSVLHGINPNLGFKPCHETVHEEKIIDEVNLTRNIRIAKEKAQSAQESENLIALENAYKSNVVKLYHHEFESDHCYLLPVRAVTPPPIPERKYSQRTPILLEIKCAGNLEPSFIPQLKAMCAEGLTPQDREDMRITFKFSNGSISLADLDAMDPQAPSDANVASSSSSASFSKQL